MKIVDQPKTLHYGRLMMNVYEFKTTNTILPMHNHVSGGGHISIVGRGCFEAKGDGWSKILKQGDIVDWDDRQNHEFISLEDNSRLINIVK